MPFNDPKSGERTRLGVYLTAGETAALLRAAADAVECGGRAGWGAIVRVEHLEHTPHPLWDSRADLTLTVGFRDLMPYVHEPVFKHLEHRELLGCGHRLAPGQHWRFCGETDMGQTLPALCTVCGGEFKRA